jgi:hypothetical protein
VQRNSIGRGIGFIASAICVFAGLYLLQFNAAGDLGGDSRSWLEILAHGIGIYFIARGFAMARSTYAESEMVVRLTQLVEFQGRVEPERWQPEGRPLPFGPDRAS